MGTVVIKILENYGLPIALVAFFIYRDFRREQVMTQVIRDLELEMRNMLKEMVTKTTEALTSNTNTMRELITMFRARPCIKV